ncbi:hypothetical protein CMUS01_07948 [Colletotrichum musicola]|uniref:Uncharacterized protein n=1 Tax=Colletotrichum musicola TaxID=2175873 RepID=A0A8H6NDX4_9PEZI|nr:hypothetical protein CMUS01_07948 [Colletotrichum musicola]
MDIYQNAMLSWQSVPLPNAAASVALRWGRLTALQASMITSTTTTTTATTTTTTTTITAKLESDNATSQYPMQREAIHGCVNSFPGPLGMPHWPSAASSLVFVGDGAHRIPGYRQQHAVTLLHLRLHRIQLLRSYGISVPRMCASLDHQRCFTTTTRPGFTLPLTRHHETAGPSHLPPPREAFASRRSGIHTTPTVQRYPVATGRALSCARAGDLPPPVLASPRGAGPFTATAQTSQRGRNRRWYQLRLLPLSEDLDPSSKAAILVTSPRIARQPFRTYHLTFTFTQRCRLEPLRGSETLTEMRSIY